MYVLGVNGQVLRVELSAPCGAAELDASHRSIVTPERTFEHVAGHARRNQHCLVQRLRPGVLITGWSDNSEIMLAFDISWHYCFGVGS
jgi:hypothetical protein